MKFTPSLTLFCQGNEDAIKVYDQMKDYYFHFMSKTSNKSIGEFDKEVKLEEKEVKMKDSFMSEVERLSGCAYDSSIEIQQYAQNPLVLWATDTVFSYMVDAVIPDTIINSIGIYTEIQDVPYGATGKFVIESNGLYTVSEAGNAQRTALIQKEFSRTMTLNAINHDVSVQVSLYGVLCGIENLAKCVRKAIVAIETAVTLDAYNALNTALGATTVPSQLSVTGYTREDLLRLLETVTAYNHGQKAMVVGTATALSKIGVDSAMGERVVTNFSDYSIQLIKNFYGYDILQLPQVATGDNYGLALDDDRLYIISPTGDKLIKGVFEGGTMSNTINHVDSANLTSTTTLNKRWAFEFISNATAGLMILA